MSTTKEQIDNKLKSANKSVKYENVEKQAKTALNSKTSAKKTELGKKAGEIKGGFLSVTSEVKNKTGAFKSDAQGKLSGAQDNLNAFKENPKEALLGETGSIADNLKNKAMEKSVSTLSSSMGVKVTVNFNDSGIMEGITEDAGIGGTISSVIGLITGLGINTGGIIPDPLQNIVTAADPSSLKTTMEGLSGKIGAAANVESLLTLATNATTSLVDTINSTAGVGGGAGLGTYNPDSAEDGLFNGPLGWTDSVDTISQSKFDDFKTKATTSASDVSTVLSDTSNGLSQDVIKSSLKSVSGVATEDSSDTVFKSVKTFTKDLSSIKTETDKFDKELNGFVRGATSTGILQGIVETSKNNGTSLDSFISQNNIELTEKERNDVLRLSQGTDSERERAIDILAKKKPELRRLIKDALENLDTTISGSKIIDTANSAFENPFVIDATGNTWKNGVGAKGFIFTFVSSTEELRAELRKTTREVTEVVVHWSDTFSNANIGSEEINERQLALGMKGIGYHYIIKRDGSLQRGRPVDEQGDHCDTNGHNVNSIGLCFIGGINAPSGTPNPTDFRSSTSLTRSQMNTFEQFCRAFYEVNPGGQILGHNEIDPEEEDPGFEVIEYCKNVFGKQSLFKDPTSNPPFTRKQLIAERLPE